MHPRYFDRQALTACWREALLAQAVIDDLSRGYSRHPQLERFRAQPEPAAAVGAFLGGILAEADARGYSFAGGKIRVPGENAPTIAVTDGQLDYEWALLSERMAVRSPRVAERWTHVRLPAPHPLFHVVPGPVERWERRGLSEHRLRPDRPVA
ncbi:pyrimidine dimer DNA glycosylase/endonuclease V [Okibacterium endophyticum]